MFSAVKAEVKAEIKAEIKAEETPFARTFSKREKASSSSDEHSLSPSQSTNDNVTREKNARPDYPPGRKLTYEEAKAEWPMIAGKLVREGQTSLMKRLEREARQAGAFRDEFYGSKAYHTNNPVSDSVTSRRSCHR